MRRSLFVLLCFLWLFCWPTSTWPQTVVKDTIFSADNTRFEGHLTLSWPAFTTQGGKTVARGETTVQVRNGSFNIALEANEGATPSGTYYTVRYFLKNGGSSVETWVVPLAGPVTISSIKVSTPPAAALVTLPQQLLTLGTGLVTPLELAPYSTGALPSPTQPGQLAYDTTVDGVKFTNNALSWTVLGGGGGSGDVTDVGNCATGAAFTGACGSTLTFDKGANDGLLQAATLAAGRTWTLPDADGTITVLGNAVTGSGSIVLAGSPALTTPTIADLSNAQHTHQSAAGGGSLAGEAIASGTVADARVAATIARDSEINVQGTANQITSTGSGVAPTLAIANPLTLPGKTTLAASGAGAASLNIPSGTAPSSPGSGDLWNESGLLKFRDATTTRELTALGQTIEDSELASNYSGVGSCTNQVITAANDNAAPSCTTITSAYTTGTFPAATHNLLSATHGDTLTASAVRGDIIIGNSTPAWARLAIGVADRVLTSNGTDPSWGQVSDAALANNYSGVGSCTNQFPRTLNDNAAPTCATVAKADTIASFAHDDDANTFTALQTVNPGTGATTAIMLDMAQPGGAGQRDSHYIFWRGTAFDSAGHNADWLALVNVTNNAAASIWTLQQRVDAGGFTDRFTVTDGGTVGGTIFDAATGFRIAGGATTGNVLRGNGTNFISAQLGFADLSGSATKSQVPAAAAYEDEANIFTVAGGLTLDNQLGLRLREADGGGDEYVEFRAPSAITTSYTLTFPATDAAGYFRTNGSGTVSFTAASGTGSCGANTFATTLNDAATPTCTQPSVSNLSDGSDVVKENQGNTYSGGGLQDMSANKLALPSSTTLPGTCTANKEIYVDTDATPAGQQVYLCNSAGNGWNLIGDGTSGGSSHNLLSSTHTDTLAGTVVRGDLVVGNSTPAWSRLAIGLADRALISNGTDASWGQISDSTLANNYSGVGSCTNQFVRAVNDNSTPTCATVIKTDANASFAHEDEANVFTAAGGLTLDNQLGLRLRELDANGDEYVEHRATSAITTSQTYTWPVTTDSRFLFSGTGGALSWNEASGVGSCTNQAVTALTNNAAPTCTTITSAYVDSSIASRTGTQTLQNKVLDNTNTFSGYTDWTEIAAPGSPAASTVRLYAKSGSGELCSKSSSGVETCMSAGAGGSHAFLSSTHTDTLAGTVVRGDIVVGNSTPAWARLALNTTAGRYLRSDGTDLVYSGIAAGGAGSCTNQFVRATADNAAPTCATVLKTDANASFAHEDEANTFTSAQKVDETTLTQEDDGIGTTSTDGIIAQNTTAAADGLQQMSPRLRFRGQGWKTDATAESRTVEFIEELLPVQGAANPSGDLRWASQVNGGGYTVRMTLDTTGALDVQTGFQVGGAATTSRYLRGNGTNFVQSAGAASGTGACTNQFARTLNDDAAPTCATVGAADFDETTLAGVTFLANSDSTWTFDTTGGTSPVISFTGTAVDISTGTLQEGGIAVSLPARSETLTNKTLNVESTGNDVTTIATFYIEAAGCTGAVATVNWDDAGDGATKPTAACNDTGAIQRPSADFSGSAVNTIERTVIMHDGWTGNLDIDVDYVTVAASPTGNVEWDISTVCRAVGESWDAAFNAAQTITDAVGSQNNLNRATQANVTQTNCAAGEHLTIRLSRDGTNDTNNDIAKFLGMRVTVRRLQ